MKLKLSPKTCELPNCSKPVLARCGNCLKHYCKDHAGKKIGLCSECDKIPESKMERETVITISSASPYAFIFTQEKPWIRKLSKIKDAELLREYKDAKGKVYAYEFAVDKRHISLTLKPRSRYDKL